MSSTVSKINLSIIRDSKCIVKDNIEYVTNSFCILCEQKEHFKSSLSIDSLRYAKCHCFCPNVCCYIIEVSNSKKLWWSKLILFDLAKCKVIMLPIIHFLWFVFDIKFNRRFVIINDHSAQRFEERKPLQIFVLTITKSLSSVFVNVISLWLQLQRMSINVDFPCLQKQMLIESHDEIRKKSNAPFDVFYI